MHFVFSRSRLHVSSFPHPSSPAVDTSPALTYPKTHVPLTRPAANARDADRSFVSCDVSFSVFGTVALRACCPFLICCSPLFRSGAGPSPAERACLQSRRRQVSDSTQIDHDPLLGGRPVRVGISSRSSRPPSTASPCDGIVCGLAIEKGKFITRDESLQGIGDRSNTIVLRSRRRSPPPPPPPPKQWQSPRRVRRRQGRSLASSRAAYLHLNRGDRVTRAALGMISSRRTESVDFPPA